jgi:hypothetical protein
MDDTAKTGDDLTPDDTAIVESTDTETVEEPAPVGDVDGDTDVSDDTGETDTEGDEPAVDEKPASRSGERIRDLVQRNKQLESKLDEVLEKFDTLKPEPAKAEPEDEIDLSQYDPTELERTKKLLKVLGLGQLEKQYKDLQSVLESKQNEEAVQKEVAKKKAAIDKFKDVITEAEFDTNLRKMLKSKDPDEVAKANHLPYESLIFEMKRKEILEREVNATLKAKKKAGPKVDAGAGNAPVPEKKSVSWNNDDPIGSMRAIEESIKKAAMQNAE